MFKSNIGDVDGTLRVLVGMVLIFSALAGWLDPWGWLGVIPLLTALMNSCPLYSILGINTCSRKA